MTVLIDRTPKASEQSLRAHALSDAYEMGRTAYVIEDLIERQFPQGLCVSSSFGADSAALLHLVSQIKPDLPVLFLETERHFFQTLQYHDELIERLGLTNVHNLTPDADEAKLEDPDNRLYSRSTDACCDLRKVRPLARALAPFKAWMSGRKRHQAATRTALPIVEWDGNHFKINPLARWSASDIAAYMARHHLPEHPLVDQGFLSIGCWPCTKAVEAGQDARSGRWAGQDKIECGIHRPIFGGEGI